MGHISEQKPNKIVFWLLLAGLNDQVAQNNGQDSFAVHFVKVEKNHFICAAPIGPKTQFGPLLSTADHIELDRLEAAKTCQ